MSSLLFFSDFEDLACGLLNFLDDRTDDAINRLLLLKKIPYFNLNCLELAIEARSLKFVSTMAVQNLLKEIWQGKILNEQSLKGKIKV